MSSGPIKFTTAERKPHTVTWILHHGCLTSSSSRYKIYRFEMGTQNKRRNMQKKTRVVICILKTPGKNKEVGREKVILWARVSPSLSSCPSAKPNYSTTIGILYLWLSGLNLKAVPLAGTLKTTWFNTFYRKENWGPASSFSLIVIGLPTPKTDSFQGPTLPPPNLTVTEMES